MEVKELVSVVRDGIKDGIITTVKREEEERRVSRSLILREARDGVKYTVVGKLGSQWVLIKHF